MVQISHPYMTTGKTTALTRWTFVDKVMSLLFNMLSRFIVAFLPRSKCLLISWLQSPSAAILEPRIQSERGTDLEESHCCLPTPIPSPYSHLINFFKVCRIDCWVRSPQTQSSQSKIIISWRLISKSASSRMWSELRESKCCGRFRRKCPGQCPVQVTLSQKDAPRVVQWWKLSLEPSSISLWRRWGGGAHSGEGRRTSHGHTFCRSWCLF